jgi:hypothetical protein
VDTFIKWVAIILFAPLVIGCAAQILVIAVVGILPYLLIIALTMGVVAGVAAGLVLRGRLPAPSRGTTTDPDLPIPPPEPIRRPRGPRRRED